MTDINTWNATDDSNNVAAPAGWPEGQMPSTVNNAARAMMGSLKRWRDQSQPTVTATGGGNAQVITYPVAPAALAAGDVFCFFALANTGPATLVVNAQAAKSIRTSTGTPLIGGEMPSGAAVMVVYDGTNFRMLTAPTPLSVANGGTGATTLGTAADAIGAVKDTGDTMTGPLTVPRIIYSGNPYGGGIGFGWDGINLHMYVDGSDIGVVGDIGSVSAGNGLTGGGASGALTLAMSGSYSGNFTATGAVQANQLVSTGNANISGSISVGGGITASGNITATGATVTATSGQFSNANIVGTLTAGAVTAGQISANTGYTGKAGTGGGFGPNVFNIEWRTPTAHLWIDNADVGAFAFTSDYRIKKDIAPLASTWDRVKALNPVSYTQAEYHPAVAPPGAPMFPADDIERWGFVAHELQQTLIPSAATGVKDQPDAIQSPNPWTVIATLTKTLQEAMARIEQLETALVR